VGSAARLLRHALPTTIRLVVDTGSAVRRGGSPSPGAAPAQSPQAWIYADESQLQQALLNLALNARDAMPAGGLLRIAVSRAGAQPVPRVRLAVSDTWTGMSPEIQGRIFEPFFTTKERGQGTGLGLAMVHGIVSEHGGTIEVQSAVGVGTTFLMTFPEMTDPRPDVAPPPRGRGELVLLAEPNQPAREIMAAELGALGYGVTQVGDGASLVGAFQRLRAQVRLVILDLELPGRGGLQCLQELRAAGRQMPVILMVGSTSPEFHEPADPAAVVLSKPFQMAELGRLVAALLSPDAEADD
jgi:CheY-like chemotaxis protein